MISTVLPLIVAIIGLVMYGFASNPKVAEIGRILLFCGVLITLHLAAGKVLHF